MKMPSIDTHKSRAHVILVANIAIIFLCLTGIPVVMGWIPATFSPFGDSIILSRPEKQLTNPVKQAVRKIPTAPALAPSESPAEAKSSGRAGIEPVLKADAGVEGGGSVAEISGNTAPR